jgi:hypothetical protein
LLIKKLNCSNCSSSEGCGCMNGGNIEWFLLIIRNYTINYFTVFGCPKFKIGSIITSSYKYIITLLNI